MSIKITEEGKTLLEDAILQDKKVVFSQIELIADVEKSPTEMVKRVDVSKVSASDYNTITVQAQIDNDGFLDTYYFNRANVYADEVLFAYDDGINICIPAETTKVINDLEMMMKIDSAVADLKIIYEGYVLRKDFDDMESKIQKINTTIKDIEANAVTQNDCTDQVSWNSQIVKKEFLTIGNMAFFRATGGFSTSRGSIVLATIPQGYFPETTGNQSSYELMGVFTSAYDKERRNCYVTLNCLSGNVDLQINNNEAYSDTRADDNVQMIFYGFWKMNTESQGGTGGSISYREDIEKLRQSIQDSKKEIVRSSREIDSLKEDIGNIFYKTLINGFDKDNTVDGYLGNDGNVHSDSRFVTSDYFDVQENKTYYALQMVSGVRYDNVSYICFYDASETFIAGGYFYASSCTSPNGSKYARVTFSSGEDVKARCMFTSIETPVKYYPFGYEYSVITKDVSELKTRKIENRLYGKTMAILGDSMAKGHTLNEKQTWAYKIANRNGMTYQKLAVNGMFITTGHGDADANCLLEQAKKINNNPDIIVIHMGTNDRNNNVELGTWTSKNTDTTNLFGALRVAFTYLAEKFPLAQVMFITPYYYQELTDYIGSIEKACMFVGWHCKNNKQGGIWAWNTNVKNALFLDDVHLNEAGQERASYEYEGFMRTFM